MKESQAYIFKIDVLRDVYLRGTFIRGTLLELERA